MSQAALAAGSSGPSSSSSKSKKRDKKPQTAAPQNERLKVVVRRLPPDLPEEIFWKSAEPWIAPEIVIWRMYYPGKARKRTTNKENISSRAYIAFKTQEQVSVFGREYDGHVFQDKSGNITTAVVEFAPYQKIPSDKKKIDPRMNSIEGDEDYISFLTSLQVDSTKRTEADTLEAFLAQHAAVGALPTTTPLLEALKAEKAAQKDKASIIRNHAHYKDMTVTSIVAGKGSGRGVKASQGQAVASGSGGGDAIGKEGKNGKERRKKDAKKEKDSIGPGGGGGANGGLPTTPEKKGKKGKGQQNAPSVPAGGSAGSGLFKVAPAQGSGSSNPSGGGGRQPQPPKAPKKRAGNELAQGTAASASPAVIATSTPSGAASSSTKPSAGSGSSGATAATPSSSAMPSSAPLSSTQSTGPAASAPSNASTASRRGRPMLGLSSRGFEAALGGAGLRSRRSTPASDPSAPGASAGSVEEARIDDSPLPPPPPPASRGGASASGGRGRGRGRGRGGGGGVTAS